MIQVVQIGCRVSATKVQQQSNFPGTLHSWPCWVHVALSKVSPHGVVCRGVKYWCFETDCHGFKYCPAVGVVWMCYRRCIWIFFGIAVLFNFLLLGIRGTNVVVKMSLLAEYNEVSQYVYRTVNPDCKASMTHEKLCTPETWGVILQESLWPHIQNSSTHSRVGLCNIIHCLLLVVYPLKQGVWWSSESPDQACSW